MSNINVVIVAGNLTREPELRRTQGGMCILDFGIAVNSSKKNQQGGWDEVPNFFDCKMFGNRAEGLSNHLHKGMKVTVSGELRYSSWEKDGQKRSKVEIVAREIELPPKQKQQEPEYVEATYVDGTGYEEDQIPF